MSKPIEYSIGSSDENGTYFRIDEGQWKNISFLLSIPSLTVEEEALEVKLLEIHDPRVTVNNLPDALKQVIDEISLDYLKLIIEQVTYTLKEG